MVTLTLEKMAGGGMYDQIGGGFHRYSTDAQWLVPHFEKMLYDNALLAVAYSEALQVTGRRDFARVVRETLDYLGREMTAPGGGFYSATDADSEGPDGVSAEGKFFVWSKQEIDGIVGADAARFDAHYGVTAGGNFASAELGSAQRSPSREGAGTLPGFPRLDEGENILHVARPDEETWAALAGARAALYAVRAKRPPPLRDEKILAAWNGLAISGFAVAGRVLGEPRYVEAAARAAAFVLGQMRPQGRLVRSWKDGRPGVTAFLDDYAFLIAGLLDLFEASFQRRWLEAALALADEMQRRFADPAGGWFMTADDHEQLIAREKPAYDGAEPSGASVALLSVQRLHTFTSDDRWRAVADKALANLAAALTENPLALAEALLAVDHAADQPREIAVVWPDGGAAGGAPLLDVPAPHLRPQPRAGRRLRGRDRRAGRPDPLAGRQARPRRPPHRLRLRPGPLRPPGARPRCAGGAAQPGCRLIPVRGLAGARYRRFMGTGAMKVTVILPTETLARARTITGEGVKATIIAGLEELPARQGPDRPRSGTHSPLIRISLPPFFASPRAAGRGRRAAGSAGRGRRRDWRRPLSYLLPPARGEDKRLQQSER